MNEQAGIDESDGKKRVHREPKKTRDRIELGRRLLLASRIRWFETQAELAKAIKISQISVSYWVRGLKSPPITQGIKVAKALNVCVEWLYTGRGQMTPEMPTKAIELAEKIGNSPPHMRALIDSVVNSIEEWAESERQKA